MKIIGLGLIPIDLYYYKDDFYNNKEKPPLHIEVGGNTLNTLSLLARYGHECYFIGNIGEKFKVINKNIKITPEKVINTIKEKYKINIDFIKIKKNEFIRICNCIIDKKTGEREFIIEEGTFFPTKNEIKKIKEKLNSFYFDIFITECNTLSSLSLVNYAKKICFIGQIKKLAQNWLKNPFIKKAHIIFTSLEYVKLSNISINKFIYNYPLKVIIIGKGVKGIEYYYNNKKFFVSSNNIIPKDTTGAGDSFIGEFINNIENIRNFDNNKLINHILKKCVDTSTECCKFIGAKTYLKNIKE